MSRQCRRSDEISEVKTILERLNAPDLTESAKQRLVTRLKARSKHPWCWPEAALDPQYQVLLSNLEKPKAAQPGDVLLVGARDDGTVSLMRLHSDARVQSSGQVLEETKKAWDMRRNVAERATRYILNPQLEEPPINIEPLFDTMQRILSGDSYGLAFSLSHASLLLNCPVSPHVVALAAIDDQGNTRRVGKLSQKIAEVLQHALNVHTFLVTPCQEEEARQALADFASDEHTLHIACIATVDEAIDYLWPDLEGVFERRLQDAGFVDELLDELYTKTLDGWKRFQVWEPVTRTLTYLLETHRVRDDDANKARFALSIALRHAGKGDAQYRVPPSIDEMLRSEKRADHHAVILRQYVQSSMDGGAPLPEDVQAALERLRENVHAQREVYSDSLRTLGAYARLLTRDGEPAAAFELLDAILDGWWEYRRRWYGEASHPLCAMLHCVALLDEPDVRARALKTVIKQMQRFEAWGVKNSHWLDFAYARALLSVGEKLSAARLFESLCDNDQAPTYMRYSSVRWRWRCAPMKSDSASAHLESIQHRMTCLTPRALSATDLHTFSHLSLLDYGLHFDDDLAIQQVEAALEKISESQLFRRLLETTPQHYARDVQWLADAYPY